MLARFICDGEAVDYVETGAMIIGNRLAQVSNGANFTLQHMLNAEENERAECIQGSPRDLHDMFDKHKRLGRRYAIMQFMVAPYRILTRDQFLTVVLPLLARVFEFSPERANIFEHQKPRTNRNASNVHWHICVSYTDPITNKVHPGWQWSHAKCERVSREIEARFEPENILLGRHQAAVIAQLRSENLHEIADQIEAAHPKNATPANRTPPLSIEQPARAAGIDLREVGKAARVAWYASNDRTEYAEELANVGLSLGTSNRMDRPAWTICDPSGQFLNILSRCLPGVSRASIHTKIGEPDDDTEQQRSAFERRATSSHVASDSYLADIASGFAGSDYRTPVGPVAPDDAGAEGRFVEALNAHDADAFDSVLSQALALAQGALARAREYLDWAVAKARAWLDHRQSRQAPPKPSDALLSAGRAEQLAARAMGEANTALHHAQLRVSRLMDAPAAPRIGEKAQRARLEAATKETVALEAVHRQASEHWRRRRAEFDRLEAEFAETVNAWTQSRDEGANRWLKAAERARKMLSTNPSLARFGPGALFEFCMKENERRVAPRNEASSGYQPPTPK